MAAYEILLLNTAIPQIQAAQSGDTYLVPRDIAFSAALTLSAGTANGVPYLNASKVLTTGSALTFNGTNLFSTGAITLDTNLGIFFSGLGSTNAGVYGRDVGTSVAFNAGNSEQMRLTSTGLGIGTSSPLARLHSNNSSSGATALTAIFGNGAAAALNNGSAIFLNNSSSFNGSTYSARIASVITNGSTQASDLIFGLYNGSQNNDLMRLDSSGNLGLGVTPSAWSGYTALQVGSGFTAWSSGVANARINANTYYNGGYKYAGTGTATMYEQDGYHAWYNAPSGTANSASVTSGKSYTVVALGSSTLAQWQAFFNDSSNNPLTVTPTLGQVLTGNATGTLLGGGLVTQNISFTQAMTLDASGNLGVGTTSPNFFGSGSKGITVNGSSGSHLEMLSNGASLGFLLANSNGLQIQTNSNNPLVFLTNNTERARITSGGDFQTSSGNSVMVGGTAARATTAGTNRVDIFDGTAPVGTLANGVSFYSASGEANVMDAAGNATLLSPHDAETNEWIFRSKHTPTGKVLKIDVERLLKFVNDHFGLDAVHEFVEK